jgi:hypothetical protein
VFGVYSLCYVQRGWMNVLFMRLFVITGTLFVIYLATNDVPMYIQKWINKVGFVEDLTFEDGVRDSFRCEYSRNDDTWSQEYMWMTGYFVAGVYVSITLEYWDYYLIGPKEKSREGESKRSVGKILKEKGFKDGALDIFWDGEKKKD